MKKPLCCLYSLQGILFTGCSKNESSIGIIGGADGPTAVFVSSKYDWWSLIWVFIIAVAVIAGVILYTKRKKK